MKSLLFLILLCGSSWLVAAENENYKIKIDWENPNTLEESIVQMCDDTYYPAVEITVPGQARKDFVVATEVDVTTGAFVPGCRVSRKDSRNSVTYIFDADSSCTVKVYQLKANPGQRPRTATYEIHDAC